VKRPTGVTIVAVLMFFGAAILALGASVFFLVAIVGMTGGDAKDPASVAIVGMGVAGGFSLLVLAGTSACLAIGVLKLCEWARIVTIASIAAGVGCTIFSLFTFMGYLVIPALPMIVCHLLVMATAVWMMAYLLRPQVKQAFNAMIA
jgi:hypothetical protein